MKICPQCQEEFEGRSNKIYCSDGCKVKAFHKRQQQNATGADIFPAGRKPTDKTAHINSKKQLAAQVELQKNKIELAHQAKLAEIEQKQKLLSLKVQELAALEAKKEKQAKLQQEQQEAGREWSLIKAPINDLLQEVIDNSEESAWKIVDLEDFIDSLSEWAEKLYKYKRYKFDPFLDAVLYPSLRELVRELEGFLKDEDYQISEVEVEIDFKKSYIRELKQLQHQLENR